MEDDNTMFCSASVRRWWLLKRALADHNLADALKLAKEAEGFITAAEEESSAEDAGQAPEMAFATNGKSALPALSESTLASDVDALLPEEGGKFNLFDFSSIRYPEATCLNGNTRSDGLSTYRAPEPASQVETDRSENKEVLTPSNTAVSSLVVLASIQQVITFLRQCDDVVVSAPEGKFLVNGRFQENATELLRRANRIRSRQGKPPFEVLLSEVPGLQGSTAP